MSKRYIFIGLTLISMMIGVFTAHAEQITTLADTAGKSLKIEVKPGTNWVHQGKMFLVKFDVTPQLAVWMEDADGNLLETFYVTEKFAKQDWGGADKDETFRPSALPYWMHKHTAKGLKSPTKNNPLPDAVTSASPTKDVVLYTKANTELSEIYVLLEVNNSFDENDTYPNKPKDKAAEYNGQPALIYRAKVNLGQPGSYEMNLVGHSSWTGADGELSEDLSTLTTAVNIVAKAVVVVE